MYSTTKTNLKRSKRRQKKSNGTNHEDVETLNKGHGHEGIAVKITKWMKRNRTIAFVLGAVLVVVIMTVYCFGLGSAGRATDQDGSNPFQKTEHSGSLILVDLFISNEEETIAIVNTKRKVHTDGVGHEWILKPVGSGSTRCLQQHGKVLDIETHGHSAIVSFGHSITEFCQFEVYNAGRTAK